MNIWNFRDEILAAAHRWYWVVASFLLGALLGWLVSFVWPAPYRATLNLYVGLNAYRATRDLYIAEVAEEEFRSLDDYKNWQMGQLNSLALSDEYLAETLTRLQSEDLAWQNVDVPTLRAMLSIAWRSAGDWHFSAQNEAAQLAAQADQVWAQVVTEKVASAVDAARQTVFVDSELRAVAQLQTAAETRQRTLLATQKLLADWEFGLKAATPDQPLPTLDHWNLLSQVTQASLWNAGWQHVLESAPPLGSLPADYLEWLLPVNALIEAEQMLLPGEIAALQEQHTNLSADYQQAAGQSQALSANIEVVQNQKVDPQITHLRPKGSLLLVGGLLGVLVLILGWLVKVTLRSA
jgi:FtsZ-binding cell division protein ZapB